MGRDGTETRERLLDAAQHLFARRGVDAVPIREINELAGQRNPSALHYHFGSRHGLLRAIVERHQPAIDAARQRYLDDARDEPRALVDALVRPLADELRTSLGRDYLRIVPQLLGPGIDPDDLPSPPGLVEAFERLGAHLGHLPRNVARERLRSMLLTATTLMADRAARIDGPGRAVLGHDAFVQELVAMVTGLLILE